MVRIEIIASSPDLASDEIAFIYESAPKNIKNEIDAGQVILDIKGLYPDVVAVAVACLNGISGLMPLVSSDDGPPIDLHEYRKEFYLKYRSVGEKK